MHKSEIPLATNEVLDSQETSAFGFLMVALMMVAKLQLRFPEYAARSCVA